MGNSRRLGRGCHSKTMSLKCSLGGPEVPSGRLLLSITCPETWILSQACIAPCQRTQVMSAGPVWTNAFRTSKIFITA